MMKDNKRENEIFDQIRQSLDSYEEAYIPGAWENFLDIQKKRKRILLYRIASGIAACLIIGFLGFNFLPSEKNAELKGTTATTDNFVKITPESGKDSLQLSPQKSVANPSVLKPFKSTVMASSAKPALKKILIAEAENKPSDLRPVTNLAKDTVQGKAAVSANTGPLALTNLKDTIRDIPDTVRSKASNILPGIQLAVVNQNSASEIRRKVRFGINFSPGVNSTQSTNSFNYTGGISADIPLSSNFQLSTGLQIENQTVVNKFPGIVASSALPSNQKETKLINLDIPVNITWKFIAEKSHAYYVSTGLSSLVYLKQKDKNTTYSQELVQVSSIVAGDEKNAYSLMNNVSVTQNTVAPIQTFDFAGQFNVILGVERKLSNRIYIHLEPFAKIPVAGLAAENLKHTTSGINFKISF